MLQITIDSTGGPVYQQIVEQIKAARERDEICPGDRLPAVRALAEQLAVNPVTIRSRSACCPRSRCAS